jgi:dipeptidyl aminopeptidase/acylaminoacyl peptidase
MLMPPGGAPRVLRVQVPGARTVLRWPTLVGNAEYLLYSAIDAASGRRALHLGRVNDRPDAADRVLLDLSSNAVVTASHVFYVDGGALTVRRLDARAGRFVGESRVLARGIVTDPYGDGQVELSVADTGAVVYVAGRPSAGTLRIVDRAGRTLVDLANGDVRDFRMSPDGSRVAYEQVDEVTGGRDIWVVDTRAPAPVRLSRHPAHDVAPTWSPDGERVYYLSQRGPLPVLVSAPARGGVEQVHLAFDGPAVPYEITGDGQTLLYEQQAQESGWDIWKRPLAGGAPTPLVRGRSNEQAPSLSRDGRWLAYSSPESEGRQVYIERVPNSGRRWRVSKEHGRQPQWQADTRALYYHGHDRQLIRMPLDVSGDAPLTGTAEVLFPIPLRGFDVRYHYGISPDGSRVVVNVPPPAATPLPATVILNAPLP